MRKFSFVICAIFLLANFNTNAQLIQFSYGDCQRDDLNCSTISRIDSLVQSVGNTYSGAELACIYHHLGNCYIRKQKKVDAINCYNKSKQLREKIDDGLLWKSYFSIGQAYQRIGDHKKTIDNFEKALSADGIKPPKELAYLIKFLGGKYSETGDYEKAIKLCETSIERMNIPDSNRADLLDVLSNILVDTKNVKYLEKAIETGNESIKVYTSIGQLHKTALPLNNIGRAFFELKKYDSALFNFEKALKLIDANAKSHIVSINNNIGAVYFEQKKYELSIKYLFKALKMKDEIYDKEKYRSEYHYQFYNIAENLMKLKKYAEALDYIQQSIICLANNFIDENIFTNPNETDLALDMVESLNLKALIAHQYYKENKHKDYLNLAEQTFKKSAKFYMQLLQNIDFKESRLMQAQNLLPSLEDALSVCYDLQKENNSFKETAFQFIELNKATVLLQSIYEAKALKNTAIPDSLYSLQKALKDSISLYKKEIDTINNERGQTYLKRKKLLFDMEIAYQRLIDELESNYPKYYDLKYKQASIKVSVIQNQLKYGKALLEYFIGDNTIYTMTIQKEQVDFHQIKKPLTWQGDIKKLGEAIIYNHNNYIPDAYALYQLILEKPLSCLNEEIKHVQIIPDAELNTIPFAALLTNKHDLPKNLAKLDYTKLSFLANQFYISYAYTGKLLLEAQKRKGSIDSINNYASFLAKDDIVTKYCAQYIDYVPKGMSGKIYKNEACNPINFKDYANKYSIVNLTMHGCGKLGSLSFTDEDLFDTDIYNLDLSNNQLIYLTACETNVGTIQKGEGVMSLSRAFTYAGCPSLVSTLWSVHPESTCVITSEFFNQIKLGKTKDVALWEAQKWYINNYVRNPDKLEKDLTAHPYYWAGIIPIGNMTPIQF